MFLWRIRPRRAHGDLIWVADCSPLPKWMCACGTGFNEFDQSRHAEYPSVSAQIRARSVNGPLYTRRPVPRGTWPRVQQRRIACRSAIYSQHYRLIPWSIESKASWLVEALGYRVQVPLLLIWKEKLFFPPNLSILRACYWCMEPLTDLTAVSYTHLTLPTILRV